MGRYFGREPRYTRQELELQAQEALEARINLGRPPEEDFVPIQARLAQMDADLAARAAATQPVPPPPPLSPSQRPLSVSRVRLAGAAAAGAPAPARADKASSAKPRASRQPVAAKER